MPLFLPDDFEELNAKFFYQMRLHGSYSADPSSWLHTVLDASELLPAPLASLEGVQRYCSDEQKDIQNIKEKYIEFASAWDQHTYLYDNITLCNSVTTAIAIVLSTLKRKGIKSVFFETPLYFAAACQAWVFGLEAVFIPTYLESDFMMEGLNRILSRKHEPIAVWISQPRTYLGTNQDETQLESILKSITRESYLIIDEAMEQEWPSVVRSITVDRQNVIKLRSITKGIGLNGLRMAYIIHPESIRGDIVSSMENFQGGLDSQSIRLTLSLIQDLALFKRLLDCGREQVQNLRRLAEVEVLGTGMILSRIQNGYIGSVAMPRPLKLDRELGWRTTVIRHCVSNRCPIILGSSMYFAIHRDFEFIRLTYFNEAQHILKGLKILASIYGDAKPQ